MNTQNHTENSKANNDILAMLDNDNLDFDFKPVTSGLGFKKEDDIEKEKAKQPEVLKKAEPVKGRRVDGSTVVAQPQVQPMFSNQTLMIGGAVVATVVVVILLATRR